MRGAFVLLCLLVGLAAAHAEEPAPETRVFVEWQAHDKAVHIGEDVELILRVGFDEPYFEQHAVQLFRQKLDVPIQLTAAWPGTLIDKSSATGNGSAAGEALLVLNGDAALVRRRGSEERDGRHYRVLTFRRTVTFERPGEIVVPPPSARFAFAAQFEEDFMGARVPVEPRFFTVRGEKRLLTVRALPEAGRPALFSGAVGHYKIEEQGVDRTELTLGQTLTWSVRIAGFGNVARLAAPPLGELEDWELRGARAERAVEHFISGRTFAYELAPRRAGRLRVPAQDFHYFRTGEGAGYRTLKTDAIDITVRPGAGRLAAVESQDDGERQPADDAPVWPYAVFGAIAGALAVLALGRRRRAPSAPAERAAGDAARREAARVALAAQPDEAALAEFLAAHLGCKPAALIGPGLVARLQAAGVPAELAQRTEETLEALVAARYGGATVSVDPALVAELQSALTT